MSLASLPGWMLLQRSADAQDGRPPIDSGPTSPVRVLPDATRAATASAAARGSVRRGIYISQTTLADQEKLDGLIRLCCAFAVDTLVVDLWSRSAQSERAARTIQGAGLHYVPRIQVFPHGGTERQVLRRDYWDMRWRSVEAALALGAQRIQLDYIRYDLDRPPDRQNTFDILKVLEFFSERIRDRGAALEIDIFGDAAGGPSDVIGQDLRLMGPLVDGICPMVYPSHYRPYAQTWAIPFQVVHSSIANAKRLLGDAQPGIRAYVEMFNTRRRMTDEQRAVYIQRQLQGAIAAGAEGWYAWSSTNSYGLLFDVLAAYGHRLEAVAPDDHHLRESMAGATPHPDHSPPMPELW